MGGGGGGRMHKDFYYFFHYLKKNNIGIQTNHWDVKLMRENAELSFAKKEGGFEIW